MRRKNDSFKLLILIVVVIGLVFAISQWNKIYVHAAEIETTSVSSGDAEFISAPAPVVVQTYASDSTDDADWTQLLDDTQNIRNYLNGLNNGLSEIQYSLTGRVSLAQPNNDPYTDIIYTDRYDYLLTSTTAISDVHISSSNDKRLIIVFSEVPSSYHFYRFYNGNWIDITSSVTSTSSARQFAFNESYAITGLNTINGSYNYSYTNLNDENTIISPLSHSNDYILITCCFVCCFVTLSMAWHTSAQFKRISNNKF